MRASESPVALIHESAMARRDEYMSAELKDPFSRAMKRAFEPPDVWTPRRLLALQIFALAGLACAMFGGWSHPFEVALCFGAMIVFGLCGELRRLFLRIQRLEADTMLRDLGSGPPLPAAGHDPLAARDGPEK